MYFGTTYLFDPQATKRQLNEFSRVGLEFEICNRLRQSIHTFSNKIFRFICHSRSCKPLNYSFSHKQMSKKRPNSIKSDSSLAANCRKLRVRRNRKTHVGQKVVVLYYTQQFILSGAEAHRTENIVCFHTMQYFKFS